MSIVANTTPDVSHYIMLLGRNVESARVRARTFSTSMHVHTRVRPVGRVDFESETLNKIQDAILRTQLNNLHRYLLMNGIRFRRLPIATNQHDKLLTALGIFLQPALRLPDPREARLDG